MEKVESGSGKILGLRGGGKLSWNGLPHMENMDSESGEIMEGLT